MARKKAQALAIDNGNIRVLGAGQNTPTPVFVHVATEQNTRGNLTIIDHPMTNHDPDAILIVSRRGETITGRTNGAAGAADSIAGVGVAFSALAEKWLIVQQISVPLAIGAAFNVMVVKT